MTIRIGHMPYLNSEPFYFGFDRQRFEFHSLPPRAMVQAAKEGKLDAGPIPLIGWFEMDNTFVPLGNFCIATGQAAQSILLFSRYPIEDMSGYIFAITEETSTSVQLLKVLLHHRYKLRAGGYAKLGEESDAFLLIGDNALRQRNPKDSYPYRYDLGMEWHLWTGMPFVFARWIVRRDLPKQNVQDLAKELDRCLVQGLANLETIARDRRDLGLDESEVIEYLRGFCYVAGPDEYRAMNHFRELLQALPRE